MAPPGRQKSEREFCLFGGVVLRPMCRSGRFCKTCRCCGGFCARCPGVFSAGTPPPCSWLVGSLPLLRLACAAPGACLSFVRCAQKAQDFCCFSRAAHGKLFLFCRCSRPAGLVTCCFFAGFCAHCLFACSALFMRVFLLSFAFSYLTFASQTSFHLSLRPRRASTFFRKESRQRFARGFAPSNPIPAPCDQSSPLPRCWPAYAAFQAANRRLTGKRLKSPGAELSFSSVSVRRSSPAP